MSAMRQRQSREVPPPENYAVAVLIITPQGIPLIRDPKKPAPIFWKAPGGRSNMDESAKAAAAREAKEEVGVIIPEDDLAVIYEEDRGSHTLVLFAAKIKSPAVFKDKGDEGEEIKFFSPQQVLALPDFFPNHRRAFESLLRDLCKKTDASGKRRGRKPR